MKKILTATTFLVISLFIFVYQVFADNYPDYKGYVNDFANVISQDAENKLEQRLSQYDKETTTQIAVATVKTTEPESIEEYSIHLADKWKPGQKDKDNGIILLWAINDRKMRIEVGRGLEGDVTDLESKQILDNTIRPLLREGKYDEAVSDGIEAIIHAVGAEVVAQSTSTIEIPAWVIIALIVGAIAFIGFVSYSPYTPIGGQGSWGVTSFYSPSTNDDGSSSSFFSGGGSSFGGGGFSGGGSSSSW